MTWQESFSAPGCSIMAVESLSEDEAYIAGGILGATGVDGQIYHTVDGGNTWTKTSVPNYYFTDLSFPTATNGFATAIDSMQQCNVLIYN